jgi:transposase
MWHVGIDLHRLTVVIAAVDDEGNAMAARRIECQDRQAILDLMRSLQPFRAVIEATGTYRWLYDLLSPLGTVLLAHPLRLRAMVQRRSKTDKLDCQLLANLLRINQIPLAYIPPPKYQQLRDVTRHRARLSRQAGAAKTQLRGLLARHNRLSPFKSVCGVRGCRWLRQQEFGDVDNFVHDELLSRLEHYQKQLVHIDSHLEKLQAQVPEVDAILDIHGIGLYTALLIIGELGEVGRFRTAKQVGSYSGLTSRVRQSGDHCYRGAITREGSPWLRWILVEAAIKATREDAELKNFYQRIRKRSGAKKARVATARKLAEICWKRLIGWHGHPTAAVA